MKKRHILIACFVLATIIGSVILFINLSKSTSPFTKEVTARYNFPLYYPATVPNGWQLDKESMNRGQGVLIYNVFDRNDPEKKVNISLQPQPRAFDFDKLYKETLIKSSQFNTSLGNAAIGKGDNGYKIGSLATGDTWILMSSSSAKVSNDDLRVLLSDLKN